MVTWKVYVDWDNDGFTAADEISSDVRYARWNVGFVDEFERVAGESQLELELANADRKYSPDNSAGTYYGKFKPHRRVKIESISSQGTITHWQGWVDTTNPDSNLDSPYANLRATDGKRYLENAEFKSKLWQSVTADEVIQDIFSQTREWAASMEPSFILGQGILGTDVLGNEADSYALDTGLQTFTYVGDTWGPETTPMQAIADLCYGEAGYFFYARDGKATFWNRQHFASAGRSNAGTLTEKDYVDIDYQYGGGIVNRVKAAVYPRTYDSSQNLLYSLPAPFQLNNQDERTIRCRLDSQDSEIEISTLPELCTARLNWTPLSRLVRVKQTFEPRSAIFEFKNEALFEFVTVDQIDVYGPKLTRKNPQEIVAEDFESIGAYGLRELVMNTTLMEDETLARTIVQHELAKRKQPRGEVKAVFLTTKPDESNLAQMLTWGIGTRFLIDDYPTAHNEGYFIIGEEHELSAGLKTHNVSYTLKSAASETYFLLDTSSLDGDDVLFV